MSSLLTPSIIQQTGNPIFEPEYKAVLNFATSQGYAHPSSAVKEIQNAFFVEMKAGGELQNLRVLFFLDSDGSGDFAKINLMNPILNDKLEDAAYVPTHVPYKGFQGILAGNTDWSLVTNGLVDMSDIKIGGASWGYKVSQAQSTNNCYPVNNNSSALPFGCIETSIGRTYSYIAGQSCIQASAYSQRHKARYNDYYGTGKRYLRGYENGVVYQKTDVGVNNPDNPLPTQSVRLVAKFDGILQYVWAGEVSFANKSVIENALENYVNAIATLLP